MPDIRAYAGVCGLWRVAALPFLYRSVWLRSMKNLENLSSILDGDPSIAKYIRRVQLRGTRKDEQDHWIYAFPSAIKTPLLALRILDIRHLQRKQRNKEGVEAFSNWISTLRIIRSVQQLHLGSVTIPSNAMTSLVCALPSLTTVWLEESDFGCKSRAQLGDEQGRIIGNRVSTRSQANSRGPLAYPVLHSPPLLESLRVTNCSIELRHLRDWLYPKHRPVHLPSLDLMPCWSINLRALVKTLPIFFPTLEELSISTQGTEIFKCTSQHFVFDFTSFSYP